LWISIWGGANTLAQALIEIRATRTPEQVAKLVAKLRVYSISDQDDAGPWIRREFPDLFYIVSPSTPTSGEYYSATWTGISGDFYYRNDLGADSSVVTNEWLETNIRSKGPLGKHYPKFMFIMEGDTPSFLSLIDNGLNAYRRPDWGGWGGRYVHRQPYGETHPIWTQGGDEFARATSQDSVTGVDGAVHVSDHATIWRWRDAFQNDFAARMTWTVADFAHANHNPVAVVNGKQQADTGTKMLHIGKNSRSTIVSKGIAACRAEQSYRGLVKIFPTAEGARNYTQCDSMLIGNRCGANTFPYIDVQNPSASVEHEASTSKIGEDQIFYCNQRGIPTEDAVNMIVSGFCRTVLKELPMEFAVEAQNLLAVSLEGAVG